MDNARSLLPASATVLQIARLALDAVERARLFRRRQSILRQWARQIAPGALPAFARTIQPALAERCAAAFEHDAASLARLRELTMRHVQECRAEAASRQALRQEAAGNWQVLALRRVAAEYTARCSGYLGTAWQSSQASLANDNAPTERPQGPRPPSGI